MALTKDACDFAQFPAEDAILVPRDCSEWLSGVSSSWWGHRYASRLRNGAHAAVRSVREMKQIVEDRLDRSSSMAFRARLPSKPPAPAAKEADRHRDVAPSKAQSGNAPNLIGCSPKRESNGSGSKHPTSSKGSKLPTSSKVDGYLRALKPHVKAKLRSLRQRADKSIIKWDRLCKTIKAHGGLTEIDGKKKWRSVMEQMRVDPAKIEDGNSGAVFRAWYVEKKKVLRKKAASASLPKKRSRSEDSDDSWQPEKAPKSSASMGTRDLCDQAAADSGAEDNSDEDAPLRPRKLTERLYQQHAKHLRDLFSISLHASAPSEPKWRACALAGNPCNRVCRCPWKGFATSGGVPQPAGGEGKVSNPLNEASQAMMTGATEDANMQAASKSNAGEQVQVVNRGIDLDASSDGRPRSDVSFAPETADATVEAHGKGSDGQIVNKDDEGEQFPRQNHARIPHIGFVCLSAVAGSSKVTSQRSGQEKDTGGAKEKDSNVLLDGPCGCTTSQTRALEDFSRCAWCDRRDGQRCLSASRLAKWWRHVRPAKTAAAAGPSTNTLEDCADMQLQDSHSLPAASTEAENMGARGEHASRSDVQDADEAKPLDVKSLERCPHCLRDFSNWAPLQKAAVSTRHMQSCCPHLLIKASPKKASQTSVAKVHRAAPPFDRQVDPDISEAETDEPNVRFSDPFAAFRCCGRTFLRTRDLERHWARAHKSGVVACAGGYADPSNMRRKINNEYGLRVCICFLCACPCCTCVHMRHIGEHQSVMG